MFMSPPKKNIHTQKQWWITPFCLKIMKFSKAPKRWCVKKKHPTPTFIVQTTHGMNGNARPEPNPWLEILWVNFNHVVRPRLKAVKKPLFLENAKRRGWWKWKAFKFSYIYISRKNTPFLNWWCWKLVNIIWHIPTWFTSFWFTSHAKRSYTNIESQRCFC